jgi:DnaJ-class molecular chaperone
MSDALHCEATELLEVKCRFCNGSGGDVVEGRGTRRRCGICNGSGFVPTAAGESILALMRHNLKPMLEDEQR